MIELGKSLRAAREAKGFTIAQLSELTRMAPSTIQDLEAENFSRIAAPIYGRGFIKLYCEAVGLEPKPYVDEFMEIFNGNRDTDIRERPVADAPVAAAEPAEIAAAEPPPPLQSPLTAPEPQIPAPEQNLFDEIKPVDAEPEPPEPQLSRYAAPLRNTRSDFNPQVFLRVGILAVTAIALLGIAVWGIRSVYRATNGTSAETETAAPAAVEPATATATETRAVRTPQKIPSLYID